MGSSTTALTTDEYLKLLPRAYHEKSEAWRKEYYKDQYTPTEFVVGEDEDEDDEGSDFWYKASEFEKPYTTTDGFTLQTVAEGGGMDEGSNAFVVVKVTSPSGHVQYFRKDGFYASHYGYDWDGDLYEVRAQEKTITVYEDKA